MPRAPKAIFAHSSPASSSSSLFIGTSGWAYPTWKPGFYPKDVPARAFLQFYASQLTSVEVNYTFRTLPSAAQLQGWLDATPAGFRFSFKAPQRITHFQRLKGSDAAVAEFVAAIGPAKTAGKLGPLLFQLPPNFAADVARLEAFLSSQTFQENPQLQVAFEFRHASWFTDAVYEVLRRHQCALCVADGDELASPDVATASFRCYRLRRSGGYSGKELEEFAQRFQKLARTTEVYAYFRHEEEPTGALSAVQVLREATSGNAGKDS